MLIFTMGTFGFDPSPYVWKRLVEWYVGYQGWVPMPNNGQMPCQRVMCSSVHPADQVGDMRWKHHYLWRGSNFCSWLNLVRLYRPHHCDLRMVVALFQVSELVSSMTRLNLTF
jgi:hypothetical protein